MTTPAAPNSISFSQVANEVGATMITPYGLSNDYFRNLAEKPVANSQISMSDLRNRTWFSARLASQMVANNWQQLFRHQRWPSGIPSTPLNSYYNNSGDRYQTTSAMSDTMVMPNQFTRYTTAITHVLGSLQSTAVGYDPFISRQVAGMEQNRPNQLIWTGGNVAVSYDVISLPIRETTYMSMSWYRSTANRQTAGAMMLLPGYWAVTSQYIKPSTPSGISTITMPAYSVVMGCSPHGGDYGTGTLGPQEICSESEQYGYTCYVQEGSLPLPSGIVGKSVDTYWYNNSLIWFLVNTNSYASTVNMYFQHDNYITELQYQNQY